MASLAQHVLALTISLASPTTSDPIAWVTLPNGITLRYLEQGDPNGRPLVMLHGYTDSWQSYERVLPLLPSRYRVIALDLRGHGGSDRPAGGYAIADMADDVVRLLAMLDLDEVTLVGHSMGSLVAREVVRRAPRRIERLVLIGSAARVLNGGTEQLFELIESFGDRIPADFIEEFQRSTFARPLPDDFMAGVLAASRSVPPRVWHGAARDMKQRDDRRRLRQIRIPTLLMWGEGDQVFGRLDQDVLLDGIPGSRLVAYAGVGHAPHWEVPGAFASDLLGFLEEEQERR